MHVLHPKLKLRVLGHGRSVPSVAPLSNVDILERHPDTHGKPAKLLEEFADRIERIYGPRTRRMTHFPGTPLSPEEATSESLALEACQKAVASLPGRAVSSLVLGSTTSVRYTGSQAAAVLGKLGHVGMALEVKSGCSTSLASLHAAYAFLAQGYPDTLVTCAETLSKVVNPSIRETWFGFADGGAALWLARDDANPQFEVERATFASDGKLVDLYTVPGPLPPRADELERGAYFMNGDAQQMRDQALKRYTEMIAALLPTAEERASITGVVTHQVNRSLTDEALAVGGVTAPVRLWSAKEHGNLGGASVLFSLAEGFETGAFQKGDRILVMSVGGGLSYAGQVLRF